MSHQRNFGVAYVPGALLIGLLGCGGDSTSIDALGTTIDGLPAAGSEPDKSPLYLVSTNVSGPAEDLTGYLALVASLDESASIDLSQAVEIAGGANAMGVVGESSVYAGLWASPTIERWDLRADGTLAPGPVVSFAQLGISDASSLAFSPLASREKSYFVSGQDLVIWNPGEMLAIGTVPLPLESCPPGSVSTRDMTSTSSNSSAAERWSVT